MMEALAMGGYGAYVWSSFSLTLIVVIICVVQVKRRHQQVFSDIKTRLRAMETEQ
jgi:heme exporter protein CcmD